MGEKCIIAEGEGEDQCLMDIDCKLLTHTECIDDSCVIIDGDGIDECKSSRDCQNSINI